MTAEPQTLLIRTKTLADQLRAACILEAAARKPGNVHPGAAFSDLTFSQMIRAAEVSAPVLAQARADNIGQTILQAVLATRSAVGTNANLGILLLLAPLAASGSAVTEDVTIPGGRVGTLWVRRAANEEQRDVSGGPSPSRNEIRDELRRMIAGIDLPETAQIFEAISAARAGGMQSVQQQDVSAPPTVTILEAMRMAQDRDLIARQYVNGFEDVFGLGRNTFLNRIRDGENWEAAIVGTHLTLIATLGDTLIARKCGEETARRARQMAAEVLASREPCDLSLSPSLQAFDRWLREDGHQRNPGSTADLVAAILFIVIHQQEWCPPTELSL